MKASPIQTLGDKLGGRHAGVPAKPDNDRRIAVIGRPNRPNAHEIESRNRTLVRWRELLAGM